MADILALVGFVAFVIGLWLLSPELALIVGGGLLMACGAGAHYKTAVIPRAEQRAHDSRPHPAERS